MKEQYDFFAQMLNMLVKHQSDDKIEYTETTGWHSSHPYYRLNIYNGVQISQVLGIYLFFNRDYLSQFDNIIEIGTYNGGLSSFIHDNKKSSARFHSWDIEASINQTKRTDINFHIKDCFEDTLEIGRYIGCPGKSLVICDGGHKTKEFNHFSKFMKYGDVIVLHDYKQDQDSWDEYTSYWQWPYGFETCYEEIEDCVKHSLEPFDNKRANFFLWGSFRKR